MKLQTKREGRSLEILLIGELDHHGAKGLMQRLDQEIEADLPLQLMLDFGGVSFMDSSGIAVVMRCRQRMRELGGSVKLRKAAQQPRKVLEAAGIQRMVEME